MQFNASAHRPSRSFRTCGVLRLPILIFPVSVMPAGTKAPIVWFSGENILQIGSKLNGMISYTEFTDRFEVEGVVKQDKTGLLMTPAVNSTLDAL